MSNEEFSYDTCEKCGEVRDPEKYPLWTDWDTPPPGRKEEPDFSIAIDVEDDEEKLMCPECIKKQGGTGFTYSSSADDEDPNYVPVPSEQLSLLNKK